MSKRHKPIVDARSYLQDRHYPFFQKLENVHSKGGRPLCPFCKRCVSPKKFNKLAEQFVDEVFKHGTLNKFLNESYRQFLSKPIRPRQTKLNRGET